MVAKRIQDSGSDDGSESRLDRYSKGVRSFRDKGKEAGYMEPAPAARTHDSLTKEIDEFDWLNFKSTAPEKRFIPESRYIAGEKISAEERKLRMLRGISHACMACSMCELGLTSAEHNQMTRDPHVFSNMKVSRVMIVGQNPEWDELCAGEPFMGTAGDNFDKEVAKHGVSRDDLYVCNIVRCYAKDGIRSEHIEQCGSFLQIEINLLKPKVIVALGAEVFSQLCPDAIFEESLKKLVPSKYGVKVFPIYHPSPIDFRDSFYRTAFENQIRVMCSLINALGK